MTKTRHYFGDINLSKDEEELAEYYRMCTNGHAADKYGRLQGKMIIEVSYNGYENNTRVISADITEYHPDYEDGELDFYY